VFTARYELSRQIKCMLNSVFPNLERVWIPSFSGATTIGVASRSVSVYECIFTYAPCRSSSVSVTNGAPPTLPSTRAYVLLAAGESDSGALYWRGTGNNRGLFHGVLFHSLLVRVNCFVCRVSAFFWTYQNIGTISY
jgi:hypothetical protein